MTDNQPGWQPDPTGRFEHRYWDGTRWTDNVSNAGVASTDPYEGGAAEPTITQPVPSQPAPSWSAPPPGPPAPPAPPAPPGMAPPGMAPPGMAPPGMAPPGMAPPGTTTAGAAAVAAGGSKKGLLIGGGILAAVIAAVVGFLVLGGDDGGDDELRAELAAMMRKDSELSDTQADCLADAIVDDVGAERFEGVDLSADEPPPEIADDVFNAVLGNLEKCNIDMSEFTGGTGNDSSDETTDTTDGDLSGLDVETLKDLFAQGLQEGSELDDVQARCLADAIVDDIGEDAFAGLDFTTDDPPAEIVSALLDNLDKCGVEPSDLGGFGDSSGGGGGGGGDGDGTYGSDPELDALYDQCEAGDFQACDDLYNESPFDSEYEEFGDTCGHRNEPAGLCVDIYGDG